MTRAPSEGRLIIQRAIYGTARHLGREDWLALSRAERYHVTQARQLMRHADLRDWADQRAARLIQEATASSVSLRTERLMQPVALNEISPSWSRAERGKAWLAMTSRHDVELQDLARAQRAEQTNAASQRSRITTFGFVGLLARSAGLDSVFVRIYARQDRERAALHAAARTALRAGHEAERQEFIVRCHPAAQSHDKDKGESAPIWQRFRENGWDIVTPRSRKRYEEIGENARDITEEAPGAGGFDGRGREHDELSPIADGAGQAAGENSSPGEEGYSPKELREMAQIEREQRLLETGLSLSFNLSSGASKPDTDDDGAGPEISLPRPGR